MFIMLVVHSKFNGIDTYSLFPTASYLFYWFHVRLAGSARTALFDEIYARRVFNRNIVMQFVIVWIQGLLGV